MTAFSNLGLGDRALAAVDALGYDTPTPVQERAIPLVLEGSDVIAAAKTGTGKTAAFSLPILDKLGHAGYGKGPLALVVTPTRELAMQIDEVCRTIAKRTKHRTVCLVGGVAYEPQIQRLEKGCDLIISTPGRLIDLINQGAAHLGQVQTLVLDEADRMLDMGFLPDVRKIVRECPEQRQTLLFSATIDANIEKNMANLLTDPEYVEVDKKGETADLIDQYRIDVDHRMKQDLLHALLNEKGGCRIIVFARTRHRVDSCVRKLRRAGFNVAPIHSDRTQNQRKKALDAFARDEVDIIVATDVLARGIDISKVNYVVNFDLPTQAEDYVHRIGRTGRAGERGFAVSFVTPDNAAEIRDIEKLIGMQIPYMTVNSFDAEKSEQALAARANRSAARKDPEIAEVVREQKAKRKSEAKARAKAEAAETPKAKARAKAEAAETPKARRKARAKMEAEKAPKSKRASLVQTAAVETEETLSPKHEARAKSSKGGLRGGKHSERMTVESYMAEPFSMLDAFGTDEGFAENPSEKGSARKGKGAQRRKKAAAQTQRAGKQSPRSGKKTGKAARPNRAEHVKENIAEDDSATRKSRAKKAEAPKPARKKDRMKKAAAKPERSAKRAAAKPERGAKRAAAGDSFDGDFRPGRGQRRDARRRH